MSDQHSPEPWQKWSGATFLQAKIVTDKGFIVADVQPGTSKDGCQYGSTRSDQADANARRIVACVNSLAGVPTEALEKIAANETQDGRFSNLYHWLGDQQSDP